MKKFVFLFLIGFFILSCTKEEELIQDPKTPEVPEVKTPNVLLKSYIPSRWKDIASKGITNPTLPYIDIDSLPSSLRYGLVAYYPFNDSIIDESPSKLNGAVISWGIRDTVIFNESPDPTYIEVTEDTTRSLLNFTNNFTLCAWFCNMQKNNIPQGIIGKPRENGGTGYSLLLSNGVNTQISLPNPSEGTSATFEIIETRPCLAFAINNGPSQLVCYYASDSLTIGWHFVVGTYDGDSLKLYIDGKAPNFKIKDKYGDDHLVSSMKATFSSLANSAKPFYIGRECENVDGTEENNTRYFFGGIDNVMVYDYDISEPEVSALYKLKIE